MKSIMLRIRVNPEFKDKVENAVTNGKAKTMSDLIRKAVEEFLSEGVSNE